MGSLFLIPRVRQSVCVCDGVVLFVVGGFVVFDTACASVSVCLRACASRCGCQCACQCACVCVHTVCVFV